MKKFIKFALVGIINTLVDLGVLNIYLLVLNIGNSGKAFAAGKAISFMCAVLVSYALNRRFVFSATSSTRQELVYERSSFFLVSLAGLVINSLTATLAFSLGKNVLPGLDSALLGTLAGLFGTCAVLLFNFFGYKNIVFRHAPQN